VLCDVSIIYTLFDSESRGIDWMAHLWVRYSMLEQLLVCQSLLLVVRGFEKKALVWLSLLLEEE
jgi:hypothetical protein